MVFFFAYGANNILTLGLNWSQIGKRGGEFSMFASAVFCQGEMTHPQPHQPSAFALENDGDSSYGFISWVTVILGEFWEMAAYRGIKIFWDLKTAESACSGSPYHISGKGARTESASAEGKKGVGVHDDFNMTCDSWEVNQVNHEKPWFLHGESAKC
jgi:hypothetical protein